jgi:Dolichyl-phosphate-mannose-protein mannosyltransferase
MHPLDLRRFPVLLALVAGAALRLYFIHAFPQIQGDSLLYGDIAKNWLTRGVYGFSGTSDAGTPLAYPTLIRLPGYPAFLVLCFRLFGLENYRAILYLQAAIDLAGCLLIAGFVGRVASHRAATIALWLAALCPFTANYVAMPLTETLSIFSVSLGLYAFARLLDFSKERSGRLWMLVLAFAWSCAALLRPDGALLGAVFFAALIVYGRGPFGQARALQAAVTCGMIALLPFAAWTARNWRTFHVFQPLAPRLATDPDEFAAVGFERWTKTWTADFASTYEVYWNVPGDTLDIGALPRRALDTPAQRAKTLKLFAQYNLAKTMTPKVDAGFAALAAERIHAHPIRSVVALPLLRLADMWLRPRVEMLNIELRWWQYSRHWAETIFAVAYGALNLAYLIAALVGMFSWPSYRAALVGYIVVRSLLLLTVAAPEARYTLECFPILIAFAAHGLDRGLGER